MPVLLSLNKTHTSFTTLHFLIDRKQNKTISRCNSRRQDTIGSMFIVASKMAAVKANRGVNNEIVIRSKKMIALFGYSKSANLHSWFPFWNVVLRTCLPLVISNSDAKSIDTRCFKSWTSWSPRICMQQCRGAAAPKLKNAIPTALYQSGILSELIPHIFDCKPN